MPKLKISRRIRRGPDVLRLLTRVGPPGANGTATVRERSKSVDDPALAVSARGCARLETPATWKSGGESRRGETELPVRLHDEHGLQDGSVSMRDVPQRQGQDFRNAARRENPIDQILDAFVPTENGK